MTSTRTSGRRAGVAPRARCRACRQDEGGTCAGAEQTAHTHREDDPSVRGDSIGAPLAWVPARTSLASTIPSAYRPIVTGPRKNRHPHSPTAAQQRADRHTPETESPPPLPLLFLPRYQRRCDRGAAAAQRQRQDMTTVGTVRCRKKRGLAARMAMAVNVAPSHRLLARPPRSPAHDPMSQPHEFHALQHH